jgi:hypothetical protein
MELSRQEASLQLVCLFCYDECHQCWWPQRREIHVHGWFFSVVQLVRCDLQIDFVRRLRPDLLASMRKVRVKVRASAGNAVVFERPSVSRRGR